MPLYKFYKIVPKDVSKTDCYIGHTIQPLRKRFTAHCKTGNKTSSKMLIENYGKDALEIVLIHELELPDKEFARREERRLYEEHKERVVNHVRPYVTDEERKEQKKQYRDENKEAMSVQQKQYREANKEVISAHNKQYYEQNKEAVSAQMKQYYETKYKALRAQNREHHNELQRERHARESAVKYLRKLLE